MWWKLLPPPSNGRVQRRSRSHRKQMLPGFTREGGLRSFPGPLSTMALIRAGRLLSTRLIAAVVRPTGRRLPPPPLL